MQSTREREKKRTYIAQLGAAGATSVFVLLEKQTTRDNIAWI